MNKFYSSKTFKILIAVLVVLILGIGAAAFLDSNSSPLNSGLSAILSPIQKASSFLADSLSDFSINFKSSATLSKRLEEKDKKISELQGQLVEFEKIKDQNKLYREFLELKEEHSDYKFTEAAVVGRDAANPFSALVLNCGTIDDVSVNDPVIYGKYLVGVVTSVSLSQCTVKTILNPDVNVSAYEVRTRDLGFVSGSAKLYKDSLCQMPGLPDTTSISPGGIVCTSGVGGIYPRDLIIGTVKEVKDSSTDISASAVIKPEVDFKTLTDVFVITEFEGQGAQTE